MKARHRLKRAIDDLLNLSVALPVAVDRHFAPGFRQTVNGLEVDRTAFIAGIETLRSELKEVRVTVLDEVFEADRYAQRHRIELTLQDESRVVREIYAFAELDAELRFIRIDEVALEVPAVG